MIVSKGKSENSINRKETFHPSLVLTFLFQIVRLLFYLVQAHRRLRIVVDRQHVPRHRDVQKLSFLLEFQFFLKLGLLILHPAGQNQIIVRDISLMQHGHVFLLPVNRYNRSVHDVDPDTRGKLPTIFSAVSAGERYHSMAQIVVIIVERQTVGRYQSEVREFYEIAAKRTI